MGSSRTQPPAVVRSTHDRSRSIVTFRIAADWLALPTTQVSSLHWRGLVADHRDPETGLGYLRTEQGLLPLLDLLPLSGRSRRLLPEFVLVVRDERADATPGLAGLLVDEFGEVVRLEGVAGPLPQRAPWWLQHLHSDHRTLSISRHGPVPVLSARHLIVAAARWSCDSSN